jgi:hypothetical protein
MKEIYGKKFPEVSEPHIILFGQIAVPYSWLGDCPRCKMHMYNFNDRCCHGCAYSPQVNTEYMEPLKT